MATATPTATDDTMRAIWADDYGAPKDVLRVRTVPRPSTAGGKLLIRVLSMSTHAGDWHLIRGTPYLIRLVFGGIRKPRLNIAGCEMCGIVESIPEGHTEFSVGDCVFGDVSACGFAAFAEYIAAPPDAVARKPDNVSADQAAACATSAIAALQAVRDHAAVTAGSRVLINGASGGVGSYAVQLAKHFGAHVTAVCHGRKAAVVKSFGADEIVDYTERDVVNCGQKFDAIVDAASFRSPTEYAPVLQRNGRYVMIGGDTRRLFQMMVAGPWIALTVGASAKFVETKPTKKDLNELASLMEEGAIVPFIDKTFEFEQIPEAIAYVEDRKVVGKVAIRVQSS